MARVQVLCNGGEGYGAVLVALDNGRVEYRWLCLEEWSWTWTRRLIGPQRSLARIPDQA